MKATGTRLLTTKYSPNELEAIMRILNKELCGIYWEEISEIVSSFEERKRKLENAPQMIQDMMRNKGLQSFEDVLIRILLRPAALASIDKAVRPAAHRSSEHTSARSGASDFDGVTRTKSFSAKVSTDKATTANVMSPAATLDGQPVLETLVNDDSGDITIGSTNNVPKQGSEFFIAESQLDNMSDADHLFLAMQLSRSSLD